MYVMHSFVAQFCTYLLGLQGLLVLKQFLRWEDGSKVCGNGAQFSLGPAETPGWSSEEQSPSLYKVWRQKIAQDIEKQIVRRLCWDSKVPGICTRTKAAATWCLLQDMGRRVGAPAPSPTRAGRAAQHQEVPGCWKWLGEVETKWETHRGSTHLLGL